ncbi:hypothetical protein G6F46_008772 [Rhizopus delemar]|uniref:Uncharacterized protein n=3 Tax=Rhizopus TaxID=4842 RepID=I1CEK8_RHIO9|nr:hypothetical protein RO3G_11599 [Rhizopus delemar RA 99-880]KAG1157839.1 hypothetical protein G6F36_014210 [Rhizopus arrhizus]KAG1461552.1 hypothetical protein G6F55_003496 [Rhizopus delemar]KAG1489691.1 hypothetical protein G6F54_011255 [Rhizopus delemar]KAG1500002.1 hypothetical protein G6F53_011400 [Rhizopus delemar]|eukprot:EIE86888.1 hypothetical protein RO3G_11599 [Rhizopus delemar RA 99-880]
MSFIPYRPDQQEQFVDEYINSDEEMEERDEIQEVDYGHTQYTVMNVVNKDSMTNDELEEMETNLANLILEEENFQLVQMKYKSYSPAQIAGFIHSLQEEGCTVPEAAKKAIIPRSTAYRMWTEFNESGGRELLDLKKIKDKITVDDFPS